MPLKIANRALFACADLHAGAELQPVVYLEAGCTLNVDQAAIHSSSSMCGHVKCHCVCARRTLLGHTCEHDRIMMVHFDLPWHLMYLCKTMMLLPQFVTTVSVFKTMRQVCLLEPSSTCNFVNMLAHMLSSILS